MILKSLGFVLAAVMAAAQQSPTARPTFDAFEVATIKPTPPDWRGGRWIRMQSTNRFFAPNFTLQTLIAAAYTLNPKEIAGGPAWIDSDRYDTLAETPGQIQPNLDEQMAMLRKLLADRFRLAFHREQKEMPIYLLTVAKGGSKLKESAAPPDELPYLTNVVFPDHIRLPAHNATMPQFAAMMRRAVLDRPVVDQTGLVGKYDFNLEWMPDKTQFGGQINLQANPDNPEPDLFAAANNQLGLKLEATRGLTEILVIDHIVRPSEN
jgi:uncharacterized protein (TIGR03435 family)